MLITGAAVTVKVAVRVSFAWQALATVQVTVVAPPHADGAAGVTGLVVTVLPQPPVALKVAIHAANFVSIAACV